MTLRLGSLCSGYEGLGSGIADVLDVELAWVADNEPAAASLLAHHWPAVPNLGDITDVDFADVEPVDVLCAGFPCQDISYAGRGEGIQEGNRSGLWHTIADAIGVLRPRIVVLENVAAIVGRRPGLDVVLADLARLGFDASWRCVRASDVGAPHGRNRWFLVAHAQDERHERGRLARGRRPGPADGRLSAADTQSERHRNTGTPRVGRLAPAALAGAIADTDRGGRRPDERDLRQRQPDAGRGCATAADAHSGRCQPGENAPWRQPLGRDAADRAGVPGIGWGAYRPAIERWERVLGHPAPSPTEPGQGGKPRLSPLFVEWLMGLPAGHVTAVPGLTRNQQLKLLGNGVVPRQAAHALRLLLDLHAVAA